jgi:hypothetical protein
MLKLIEKESDWGARCHTETFQQYYVRFHEQKSRAKKRRVACHTNDPDEALIRAALERIEIQLRNIAKQQRFRQLAAAWKSETKFLSNVTAKVIHPAYQKIIGMGQPAVPLILKDLEENGPKHWFWALTAITEVNPIPESMAGNMTAMTEAWLKWGKRAGYLRD